MSLNPGPTHMPLSHLLWWLMNSMPQKHPSTRLLRHGAQEGGILGFLSLACFLHNWCSEGFSGNLKFKNVQTAKRIGNIHILQQLPNTHKEDPHPRPGAINLEDTMAAFLPPKHQYSSKPSQCPLRQQLAARCLVRASSCVNWGSTVERYSLNEICVGAKWRSQGYKIKTHSTGK